VYQLLTIDEQADTNRRHNAPQELGSRNIVIQEEIGQDGRNKRVNGNDRGHVTRSMLVDHVQIEVIGRDIKKKNE
jgi:hypothetical protein